MIDVEVKGFQSIEHLHIKLEGFSALVGRSNIGKSAVIRAIRCALTNPLGTSYVRHGRDCARLARKNGKTCKCQSSVHIKAEGFDLLWEKGDAINRYHYNGQMFDKPGPGVPEFLCEAGFAPVKVGDLGSLQIADQFFPIFLLNQSGPAIAEAISDVSRLDRINTATKLAEKDRREVVASRKTREGDVKELEGKLSQYEGLNEAVKTVGEAEKALDNLLEAQRKVEQLERFVLSLEGLAKDIRRLQEASKIDVDEPAEIEALFVKARECRRYHETLDGLAHDVRRLGQASKVEFDDPDQLVEDLGRVVQLARFEVDYDRRSREVHTLASVEETLRPFPEDDPVVGPAGEVQRLGAWMSQLRKHKETLAAHEKLAHEPGDVVLLEGQADKARAIQRFLARLEPLPPVVRDLDAQAKKLGAEEAAIEAEIDALGVCPTCARPMKEGHAHVAAVISLPD